MLLECNELLARAWVLVVYGAMHLRVSTQHRNGKTYRYAQLVQSYRDERGRSTQRVVKHLGRLPDTVIEAIRLGLKAQPDDAVMLSSAVADLVDVQDIASRRYLDIAVLLDCWNRWGLTELLDELGGAGERGLSFSDTVLSLAVQRCCAPGSKLHASRWVPQTALPELLHFEPTVFNNTRVHRTLQRLYEVAAGLQERLSAAAERPGGGFNALFMDVTDTWFEGIGSSMAEQTRTKTEMPNKRCLAIVLLVDDRGYPLRWCVVGGKTKDWVAMRQLLERTGGVPWLRKTPVVFDRAMGTPSMVSELKRAGLWFLTAAHSSSIETYTSALAGDPFGALDLGLKDETYDKDIERVAQAARAAGYVEIHDRLFAIDLGTQLAAFETETKERPVRGRRRLRGTGLARHLERASAFRLRLDAAPGMTQGELAAEEGISDGRVNQLLALLRLSERVRARIAQDGDAFPLSESDIRPLLNLGPEDQEAAIDALILEVVAARTGQSGTPKHTHPAIGPLRMVAYFNPRLFVDFRRRRRDHLEDIQARVRELNDELATARRSRKHAPTYRKFSRELERRRYLDAFDIALEPIEIGSKGGRAVQSFRGTITLKAEVWQRRRRHDGFVLLLGHPDLAHSAADLVALYRQKDVVEKDFQTIKSVIELRPVYHYTDPKVDAHVTVCMLALLLERTLRTRLRDAGLNITAETALAQLAACRLGQRPPTTGIHRYHVTALTPEQQNMLDALGLARLADQAHVRQEIRYRVS